MSDRPAPIRPKQPRPQRQESVPRPEFPPDAEVHLPKRVRNELRQGLKNQRTVDDVLLALSLGAEAIEEEVPEAALPFLRWAKSMAQRSPSIREALGVAYYLSGDFAPALNELRTYRRMAASADQNHLIADCLRALGHPVADVAEAIGEMLTSDTVDADRKVEGLLVWAGALADAGDIDAAKAVLRRADRRLLDDAGAEARERFQYLAGELALKAGDAAAARAAWTPLSKIEDDPYGLLERLEGSDLR